MSEVLGNLRYRRSCQWARENSNDEALALHYKVWNPTPWIIDVRLPESNSREWFGESVPDEVLSIAPTLFSRGFHPQTAVRLVLHGLGRYALKTKPEDWPNWPVQMDWFRQWPTEEDGRRRR